MWSDKGYIFNYSIIILISQYILDQNLNELHSNYLNINNYIIKYLVNEIR